MSKLAEVIAAFRALEDNSTAVAVIGDDQAMRVLVAWQSVDNEWTEPQDPCPDIQGSPGKAWAWLRRGWILDAREVARLADLPVSVTERKLDVIIGNRLIYPDGQLAKGAELALSAFTAKRLGIKVGQKKNAPKRDDGDAN